MSGAGEPRNGVEEELRQVVWKRVAAVHAKDPEPLAVRQAPDVVTFDVLPPLHARGSDAVEAKTHESVPFDPATGRALIDLNP